MSETVSDDELERLNNRLDKTQLANLLDSARIWAEHMTGSTAPVFVHAAMAEWLLDSDRLPHIPPASETPGDDELRAIEVDAVMDAWGGDAIALANSSQDDQLAVARRAVYNAGRVSSAPSREAIAEAIRRNTYAMYDGDTGGIEAAADAVVALMKENQGDKG